MALILKIVAMASPFLIQDAFIASKVHDFIKDCPLSAGLNNISTHLILETSVDKVVVTDESQHAYIVFGFT